MKKDKSLDTILVLVLALVVFYLLKHKVYLLYAALVLGAIGLFIPSLARNIHWAWMKLAEGLGFVMSKVILSLIFIVFLVPLSFLKRSFSKKGSSKNQRLQESYFTDRNVTYTKESLENVW